MVVRASPPSSRSDVLCFEERGYPRSTTSRRCMGQGTVDGRDAGHRSELDNKESSREGDIPDPERKAWAMGNWEAGKCRV